MKANEKQMIDLLKRTLNLLNDPNADGFQIGNLQGDIAMLLDTIIDVPVVIGDFHGNQLDGEFEWDCPTTGVKKSAWGQFSFDETGFFHYVYNDNDQIAYIVKEA
jgi:hypothetical protein